MKSPQRRSRPVRRNAHGFLLLEALLAIGVFAIAVTGFTLALSRTADLADQAQRRLAITRLLRSALAEAMSYPVLEEGKTSVEVDEMATQGMQIVTTVELLPEMENEDGQMLQEMYRIEVAAHWNENSVPQEEVAETWRYSRLYQP
jgi:type II secretory pathway pseudopilin PulG